MLCAAESGLLPVSVCVTSILPAAAVLTSPIATPTVHLSPVSYPRKPSVVAFYASSRFIYSSSRIEAFTLPWIALLSRVLLGEFWLLAKVGCGDWRGGVPRESQAAIRDCPIPDEN